MSIVTQSFPFNSSTVPFTVRVIDSKSGFKKLQPEWNQLLLRSQSSSIFCSWEWLYTWYEHFGSGCVVYIIAVHDPAGKLIGLGPFGIFKAKGVLPLRQLRFLGSVGLCSEYLDILAETGREADVADAILEMILKKNGRWDALYLSEMLPDALLLRNLERQKTKYSCYWKQTDSNTCPYLDLPSQLDEFYSQMNPQTRSTIRRKTRKLLDSGAALQKVTSAPSTATALLDLFALHSLSWSSRGETGNFHDISIRRFHQHIARTFCANNWLTIYSLVYNSVPVASLYGYLYKNVFYYWQAGFNPEVPTGFTNSTYSPGLVLMHECMVDLIQQGVARFDFLRGDEEYKKRWTKSSRKTINVLWAHSGKFAVILDEKIKSYFQHLKKIIKKRLLRR
jgi:CelD/BcsL family acetyltransferase involved in cellulose biosynthesis